MRTSVISQPAARQDVEPRVGRSFARGPKQSTRTRAYHIELPQKLWDRFVLFMFTCCLFTFLHAFFSFGFSTVDKNLRASNDFSVLSLPSLSVSLPRSWGSGTSNGGQGMRARSVTRVMVDWHGSYELLPSTMSALDSPASIRRDAFLDPTPTLVEPGLRRALEEDPLSTTTQFKTPVDRTFMFYGTTYNPFQLEFEDSRGLYPIMGLPRTAPRGARTRRFGRCFPREACL